MTTDQQAWTAVCAAGTDPSALAHVVALAHDEDGRSALRAGGAAVAGYRTSAQQRRQAAAARDRWAAHGVRVALPGDASWPTRLDRLAAPPWFLAVRGRLPSPDRGSVAIVGARRATAYGTGVAAWLAEEAAAAAAVVVSGGARGIDAAAHLAAVHAGTVVVLGCGHDVAYPRPHARAGGLFDEVLAGGGCLVSEQLPGSGPRPHVVRARNRLVAALADLVVVVEGGHRSGALLTSTAASEIGVDVLAVPGDVRAPGSAAPHRLLREGAGPCVGPADLLATLAAARPLGTLRTPARDDTDAGRTSAPTVSVLPPSIRRALDRAWPRPLHAEQLAAASATPIGQVLAAVTRGVVAGELAESAEGVRLRRSPPTGGGGGTGHAD